MFGRVVSNLFYVGGAITFVIGLMISAMIVFNLPGYVVPLFIGVALVIVGAITQAKLRPTMR